AAYAGHRLAAGLDLLPFAGAADLVARKAQLALDPENRLLEGQLQVVSQVGAALHALPLTGRASPAEEGIEEVFDAEAARSPVRIAHAAVDGSMPEAVIGCAALAIREHLVGLLHLLEHLGRARI